MQRRLLPLFLSQSFRSAAVSLISFFSAVYIYKLTSSFLAVFAFFLIFYVFKLIGTSLAENLSLKTGLKRQVVLGQFLNVLALAAFLGSANIYAFLWLASFFWGLSAGFFWFGWHGLLAKDGYLGEYGRALGSASAIETIFLVSTPLLGGILVSQFGYQALFVGALGFLLLGFSTPVFLSEHKTHKDVTFKEILKIFITHKKMFLTYFSHGATGTLYSVAFILYLFLILKKEMDLGLFFCLSMVLVALANLLIGRWVDARGKKRLVIFGSCLASIVWFGRFLIKSITFLFVLDIFYRIALGMLGIPLGVLSYEKATDGGSTGRAILFREGAITFGSIFVCVLLAIFNLIGLELRFSFLAGIIFSLFPLLIVKKQGIYGE